MRRLLMDYSIEMYNYFLDPRLRGDDDRDCDDERIGIEKNQ
jgi:hypothetical protein